MLTHQDNAFTTRIIDFNYFNVFKSFRSLQLNIVENSIEKFLIFHPNNMIGDELSHWLITQSNAIEEQLEKKGNVGALYQKLKSTGSFHLLKKKIIFSSSTGNV